MLSYTEHAIKGYERVLEAKDPSRKLHAIFAIHSTAHGPAVGGTRAKVYANTQEALTDVLRLSRGMSHKSAGANLAFGGGKSVIILTPGQQKTPELLDAYAEALNTLKGKYSCGIDLGTNIEDMEHIAKKSNYILGIDTHGTHIDLSFFTAWGCFRGIEATAKYRWGSSNLANKTILIQGLGHVGRKLAEHLFWAGAKLKVCDINPSAVQAAVRDLGAKAVSLDSAIEQACDIWSPCATGGVINANNAQQLQCEIIAGAANNQLLDTQAGEQVWANNILYAPDFIINAGGIIAAAHHYQHKANSNPMSIRKETDQIYERLLTIFAESATKQIPTDQVAIHHAEMRIQNR